MSLELTRTRFEEMAGLCRIQKRELIPLSSLGPTRVWHFHTAPRDSDNSFQGAVVPGEGHSSSGSRFMVSFVRTRHKLYIYDSVLSACEVDVSRSDASPKAYEES